MPKFSECPARILFHQISYFEGMNIELPCRCKLQQIKAVTWYYKKHLDSKEVKVLTDFEGTIVADGENHNGLARFIIQLSSLIIVQSNPTDSGHYICGTKAGQFFYSYEIDVQRSDNAHVSFEEMKQHPMPDLLTNSFKAFTVFWDWSRCNRCDVRGEQRRLGLCYIQSPSIHPLYRLSQGTVASCGSDAVPYRFKQQLSNRTTEIFIRNCKKTCKKKKMGVFGAIANITKNVATYLKKEGLIRQFLVPVQVSTQPIGGSVTFSCPGARPQHAIAWDKDKKQLYLARYLSGLSKTKRVYIDHRNNLHIQILQRSDRAIYYCWMEGKLKAGFRLVVRKSITQRRSFSDSESIFALKFLGMCFLIITGIFVLSQLIKCCYYNFKCCPS
ncbi:hypothetical protein GDO86_006442 [Hymenochirus boettgeri]|uniref:Ig-like domain-containing protein n=1 Tax=Hymenochirus boettgeri TaxID=247094 RepID=A0A8T2J639_9PIPI|nr:hypothetical protein GDO86_006442 [Hymenochirus boettgeri]